MNLLSGLEKFGFDQKVDMGHLYDEEEKKAPTAAEQQAPAEKEVEHKEEDYLLDKTVQCPVCDNKFHTRVVKSGRVKRLEPDSDLRPRFDHIDTNKYDVSSCPKCGYTAMNRYFSHISSAQIKLLREGVQSKFKPAGGKQEPELTFSYEKAIERYKLALFNTVVKRGRASEKAYECLKLSWLYRGWLEELGESVEPQVRESYEKEQNLYYEEAYEGFVKALASEHFPMCGMEEPTVNLLMANMAYRLKKNDQASHFITRILSSNVATHSVKERARDLKEEIIQELRSARAI